MTGNGTLQQHQDVLFSLLLELDRICRRHGIEYMLFAGSALGAVRHGDFIPWDDDLDVVMMRDQYRQFMAVAPEELKGGAFHLQAEFGPHWPMFFSKLRKNNTTCLECYVPRDLDSHQGIYIDIFPCDSLSPCLPIRWAQFAASKVVIAQSLGQRGYETDSAVKRLFMQVCRILPQTPFLALARGDWLCDTAMVHTFFSSARSYRKNVFPRQWLEDTVCLPFHCGEFPVSAHYDRLLTRIYGNYHQMPPPDARACKRHCTFLDIDHSYEIYAWLRTQRCYSTYTRSIR